MKHPKPTATKEEVAAALARFQIATKRFGGYTTERLNGAIQPIEGLYRRDMLAVLQMEAEKLLDVLK